MCIFSCILKSLQQLDEISIFVTTSLVCMCACKRYRNFDFGKSTTCIQWNPSIAATLGEQNVGRYIGVAFIEGLFCTQSCSFGTWVPGRYTEVAVKRGSTVFVQALL